MSDQTEGGCMCGAVRFVATGEPIGVAWCHCQSCRKHSGAPVSVFVAFRRDACTATKGEITSSIHQPAGGKTPQTPGTTMFRRET